jgi:hypothetical protein
MRMLGFSRSQRPWSSRLSPMAVATCRHYPAKSLIWLVSDPANREINREFRQVRSLCEILKANKRANSKASSQIPYSTEQGIISAEQGILALEQGILPTDPRSPSGEVFVTHNDARQRAPHRAARADTGSQVEHAGQEAIRFCAGK